MFTHALAGEMRESVDSGNMGLGVGMGNITGRRDRARVHSSRGTSYAGQSHNTCWLPSTALLLQCVHVVDTLNPTRSML